jgi:hypothetical protein
MKKSVIQSFDEFLYQEQKRNDYKQSCIKLTVGLKNGVIQQTRVDARPEMLIFCWKHIGGTH